MATLSHRRTHNLLLISKLLNRRDHASPFTLVLDSLEQPARPLIREYIRRANLSRTSTIFLSFETSARPQHVDTYIPCYNKSPAEIQQAINAAASASRAASKAVLVLFDSLIPLILLSLRPKSSLNLTAFLSSILQPRSDVHGQLSLVAVFHADVPLDNAATAYAPTPLSLLFYLATTIITVHSLSIMLAEKRARERSQAPPRFGLAEQTEGILVGLKALSKTLKPEEQGIVLELEHRRKSGRGVLEWFFLPTTAKAQPQTAQAFRETVTLLDDHPLFRKLKDDEISDQELAGMTFELGLTERQREEREGVVLPYFDAQKTPGGGEGGRILYDMGVEDDFDEEEDEI